MSEMFSGGTGKAAGDLQCPPAVPGPESARSKLHWIRALNAADYSLYAFCDRFNLRPCTLQRYITGKILPRKATVKKVEDALKRILTDERIPRITRHMVTPHGNRSSA